MSSSAMASSEAVIARPTNAAAEEKATLTSCQPSVAAPPSAPSVSLAPPLSNVATSSEEVEVACQSVDPSSSVALPQGVGVATVDASDNGNNANVSGIASTVVDIHNAITAPPLSSTSSANQRSRRSRTNYHQDYSHDDDGLSITELEDDEIIQYDDASNNSNNELFITQPSSNQNEEIALSMKDPRYKSIMHSFFQQLGRHADGHEEEMVGEEAVTLFKKYGGGVFVNYINFRLPHLGTKMIDEKTARASKCWGV